MDFKNFIYLNDRQRSVISLGLVLSVAFSGLVIVAASYGFISQDFKPFGFELFKMSAAACAIWILVLLHTSSNSKRRIEQEMDRFLSIDLVGAFGSYVTPVKNYPLDPLNVGLSLRVVARTSNSSIYTISNNLAEVSFYCRVTLQEVIVLFYLPEKHKDNWIEIYKTALEFWDQNGVGYSVVGVHPAMWHRTKSNMLEIRILRPVSRSFLFDVAERMDLSEKIVGDARAMLMGSIS